MSLASWIKEEVLNEHFPLVHNKEKDMEDSAISVGLGHFQIMKKEEVIRS